jgi:carbon-monoxide dehydrogenase large subunit
MRSSESTSGFIGLPLKRVEDPRLLTGGGCYVADIDVPGRLHAAFVRSPFAHARIDRIDTSEAQQSPGVIAVLTGADMEVLGRSLPTVDPGPESALRAPSPLAAEFVRFAGEAVAVVIAESFYAAVDATECVVIEWEPLASVVDPFQALEPGAPLVHDRVEGNLVGPIRMASGDASAAIEASHSVVRRDLSVARSACGAMETRGCLAEPVGPDGGRGLTLTTSTQAPHNHRTALAAILELPFEAVRVRAPDVGGGFGPKGRLYPEEVAVSVTALHLNRPIVWQSDRSEDLASTYQGRGTHIDAELAADESGRLVAMRARLVQDCGAYLASGLMVPGNTAMHMLGPYHLANVSIEIVGAYTNKAPLTPLRGGGREVGAYVIERMMDHLAKEMGIDPLALRQRNALARDEFPFDTGMPTRMGRNLVYDSGDFHRHLARARELIEYDRPVESTVCAHRKGTALTLFIESTGFASETARAWLQRDGSIRLAVGSPSNGQGHATVMPQIFAQRLGVAPEMVRYESGDTAVVAQGVGTFGSRIGVTAGNAVAAAAIAFRQCLLEAAEDVMEAAAGDLELVDGAVRVKGYPHRSITLAELASSREGEEPLTVETPFEASGGAFAGGAHAAVVDVDLETGLVRVDKYVVVHDCGTVINPLIVDGQVHGGVIHGLGNALGERMSYDEETGQLLTGILAVYQLPVADSAPAIEVVHHETPSPNNPEGIKGAGEGGTIGALATIARAVEDALSEFGVEVNDLPVEPQWILDQIRQV